MNFPRKQFNSNLGGLVMNNYKLLACEPHVGFTRPFFTPYE
jgi:hypothetical protein